MLEMSNFQQEDNKKHAGGVRDAEAVHRITEALPDQPLTTRREGNPRITSFERMVRRVGTDHCACNLD